MGLRNELLRSDMQLLQSRSGVELSVNVSIDSANKDGILRVFRYIPVLNFLLGYDLCSARL